MDDLGLADGATPVVYFIGWPGSEVKIGFTRHVGVRFKELRYRTGLPLQLLATVPGSLQLEREYHQRFAEHRYAGEWFHWCPEIEAEIARLTDNTKGSC